MVHTAKHILLLLWLVFGISHAAEYTVTNTATSTIGGYRFSTDIGEDYFRQTMVSVTDFVWKTLQQGETIERKDVQQVTVYIDENDEIATYTTIDETEIHISARYIQGCSGDVKEVITGILYHEVTHMLQWNGNGQAPIELREGIADYVRLKAGYESSEWAKPGEGERWNQGNGVTARFLQYCNCLKDGFVAELNKKMKDDYSHDYFYDLLGKNVDQLWTDYKAQYNVM